MALVEFFALQALSTWFGNAPCPPATFDTKITIRFIIKHYVRVMTYLLAPFLIANINRGT